MATRDLPHITQHVLESLLPRSTLTRPPAPTMPSPSSSEPIIYTSPFPSIQLPSSSIFSFIFDNKDSLDDSPAYIDAISGITLTRAKLYDQAMRLAWGVRKHGLNRGDVAMIFRYAQPHVFHVILNPTTTTTTTTKSVLIHSHGLSHSLDILQQASKSHWPIVHISPPNSLISSATLARVSCLSTPHYSLP